MFISLILMMIYVFCSALGLTLLKMGINAGTHVMISASFVDMKFHMQLILGAVLYVFSFLLNMVVMSRFDLSFFYPLSAGMIYIAIIIFSILILKEKVSTLQVAGMIVILFGIVLMNMDK